MKKILQNDLKNKIDLDLINKSTYLLLNIVIYNIGVLWDPDCSRLHIFLRTKVLRKDMLIMRLA